VITSFTAESGGERILKIKINVNIWPAFGKIIGCPVFFYSRGKIVLRVTKSDTYDDFGSKKSKVKVPGIESV